MILEDWHTHSSFCRHATGNLEQYVKAAIDKKLSVIGLSDHFPYDVLDGIENMPYHEYSMPKDELGSYVFNAINLREKYKNQISVKIAFELDFIEKQVDKHHEYLERYLDQIDYIIGSIHNLNTPFGLFAFDDFRFLKYYDRFEDTDEIFMNYYETMQAMISSEQFHFTTIGHFDLPKKFNILPNNKELIMEEEFKALQLAKKRDIVIEINTSGLRRPIKEQYPRVEIIKEMFNLGIDIVLGSDAHHPNEIAH
ncbi:MAG: histidinol-phosphatase HisJ, partial [Candidatus Lokiarchaeota archaeon]|nr:histidinol-phosphatase HisJ [Candidatus Lokiarchaeota archaeon]